MKAFTKEQLDGLKQYEDIFFRAVHQDYYRSMNSKTLDAMKEVYDSTADKPYDGNWFCNHCVLAFLKVIGRKYYDDLDAYGKQAVKLVEVLDEVFGEVPDDTVPKEPEPKPKKKPATKKTAKKATKKK